MYAYCVEPFNMLLYLYADMSIKAKCVVSMYVLHAICPCI